MPSKVVVQPKSKKWFLAMLLAIIPGVGHLYVGQTAKGVFMLITAYPVGLLWIPMGLIDAVVMSRRLRRGCCLRRWEWFWCRAADNGWRLVDIRITGRSQTPIGREERVVDNIHSGSKLIRNLKVAHEWTFTYDVEHESSRKTIDTASVQLRDGVTKGRTIESCIRTKYGYSQGERKTHEETVQVEVPALKRTRVTLEWNNINEEGVILIADPFGNELTIPYSAVIGITFDIYQHDEIPA